MGGKTGYRQNQLVPVESPDCAFSLLSSRSREHQQGVAVLASPLGFRSARKKKCSVNTELRGKNLNFLVGNVHTADGISAAWSTLKRVEGSVLKLEKLSIGKAV